MKKTSIFDEVRTAIEEKNAAKRECDRVEVAYEFAKAKAIQEVENRFRDERESKEEKFEAKLEAYNQACERLYYYGYFAVDDIVPILAIFMSYVEGERFVPCISSEAENNSIIARASLVREKENVSQEKLEEMYDEGDAITLSEDFSSCVKLYNVYGSPNSRLGSFNYIRKFLQRFVEYRAENDLKWHVMVPDKITYKFMAEYLVSHPELKNANKDKRDAMLSGENEEFRSECAKLELVKNKKDE